MNAQLRTRALWPVILGGLFTLQYASAGCSTGEKAPEDSFASANQSQVAVGEDASPQDSSQPDAPPPTCATCENNSRPMTSVTPALAPGQLLPLDKKGDKPCPLPAGCKVIKGNAEWLQCHREGQGGVWNGVFYCSSFLVGGCGYSLSGGTQQQAIADSCKGKPTLQAQMECVAAALEIQMADAGNVCRNYGVCMYKIGKLMGLPTGFNFDATHVWNEYTVANPNGCGTQTLIIDAYNNIEYTCPDGSTCKDAGED